MKTAAARVSIGRPDTWQVIGGSAAVVAAGGLAHLAGRADWSEIGGATLAVKVHLGAAVGALALGAMLMAAPKGRTVHRRLGWTWAVLMAVVALSSFFIREAEPGRLSWIHALSGWVLLALPMGLAAARRRRVHVHRRTMGALFYGGLVLAGAFTFVPERLLWRTFIG